MGKRNSRVKQVKSGKKIKKEPKKKVPARKKKKPIKRDKKGRWLPGESGNKNGRPKGVSITEMVRFALDEVEPKTKQSWKELIVKKILLKAIFGDTQMIKTLWSYIDGMPNQPLSGEFEHTHLTFEDALKLLDKKSNDKRSVRKSKKST